MRAALRSEEARAYRREKGNCVVDAVGPEIRRLLVQFPRMPAR